GLWRVAQPAFWVRGRWTICQPGWTAPPESVAPAKKQEGSTMLTRRHTLAGLLGPAATFGLGGIASPARGQSAALGSKEKIRVTKIYTFVLTNSWVYVKISTDAGITGWGEMLKDDAKACAAGALEVGDY